MYDCMIRVILSSNGSVNIAFSDRHTICCTPLLLKSLFEDPIHFYDKIYPSQKKNTRFVNPKNSELPDIPGLTLAYVEKDRKIVVIYPEIFSKLFSAIENHDLLSPMYLVDYLNKEKFSDEKQLLLRFFMDFGKEIGKKMYVDRFLYMPKEAQTAIFNEMANVLFSELPKKVHHKNMHFKSTDNTGDEKVCDVPPVFFDTNIMDIQVSSDDSIPAGYVSAAEYCRIHDVQIRTLYTWIYKKKLRNFYKAKNKTVWLDPSEIAEDLRKERKSKPRDDSGSKYITCKSNAYEDVQTWMTERKLFTDKIKPFIRIKQEASYYEHKRHKEVHWPGVPPALILDVKLDYFCEAKGKTNRQIILEDEESPVIPHFEDPEHNEFPRYVLHHIGQLNDSPYAVIPAPDHSELFSIFHPFKEDKIDRDKFEIDKRKFWVTYVEQIDGCKGGYRRIPYKNSKHTKDQR